MAMFEGETEDVFDRIVLRLRTPPLVPQTAFREHTKERCVSFIRVLRKYHTDSSGAGVHLGGALDIDLWRRRLRVFIAAVVNTAHSTQSPVLVRVVRLYDAKSLAL